MAARRTGHQQRIAHQRHERHVAFSFALVGYLLQYFGFQWDVAFHVHLLRDSFWTLPHLFVYVGVALVFVAGAAPLFVWRHRPQPWSVVFVASTALQALAAPVDDWFHRMYGVDNTIWSVPHLLFVFGGAASVLGIVLALPTRFWRPGGGAEVGAVGGRVSGWAAASHAPVWAPRRLVRDPAPLLFGLFLGGLTFTMLEFQYHIPPRYFPYPFWLFPPLMIGIALLAGMAAVGATGRVGALTATALAFTAFHVIAVLEIRLLGARLLPTVPLLLPAALLADALLAWPRRVPLAGRIAAASLGFGMVFYATQYAYTRWARPAWDLSLIGESWLLAVVLALLGGFGGYALGSALREARSGTVEAETERVGWLTRLRMPRLPFSPARGR